MVPGRAGRRRPPTAKFCTRLHVECRVQQLTGSWPPGGALAVVGARPGGGAARRGGGSCREPKWDPPLPSQLEERRLRSWNEPAFGTPNPTVRRGSSATAVALPAMEGPASPADKCCPATWGTCIQSIHGS